MTGLTRKPAFWIAFALISAVSLAIAWRLFPQAIPVINLDVKMSREQALEQASAIADKFKLAPLEAQRAVLFAHDGTTQNFVELEAGGKPAFTDLLSGRLYAPYWWDVRLFKPGETREARVRFRPDGSPYGFWRRVPESEEGAKLDASAARAIAEQSARSDWLIDFAPYKLLEQSQALRPSGRVDHVFVYERVHETLGDGRFRMRLTVSGDELTELTHLVFVPEAFDRRYQELRSANNAIARVATLAAGALYGIGGCILGTVWLLRKRALAWKPALVAGALVAGLNALVVVANSPTAWFGFDTAQGVGMFWGAQIGRAIMVLVIGGLGLALVFMAAESLARRAFPDHPQLWRLWSRDAAATPSVLGRTAGGYLCVPIELALIAAFYFVTNRYLGWWQPSESLTDPNILGSALPGLAPIGMATQAGFMEECLFRAVPLSIAALIGDRLGHRRLAIGIALIVEALIFGGAHANYPGFPSYSRLVELTVPSLVWGLIFIRFGLLPTVILHAVFDLVLMSIPVFLVQGPGSGTNQALVVVAGLVPLAIVLGRRAIAGRWSELPTALRNGGWQSAALAPASTAIRLRAEAGAWTTRVQRALPVLGIGGLLAIVLSGGFHADAPPLRNDRAAAEAAAETALKDRGVTLGAEWRRFAATRLISEEESAWLGHKFVWREAGHDAYRKLVGNWLAPPLWEVRYARFDRGDVADRAEEWRVTVAGDGEVRQVRHQLPEKRPGARLSRDDARKLAQQEIRQRFGLDTTALREVEVKEDPQPARTDWRFIYADPLVNVGHGGEARVLVAIAGNEVAASGRYVFVPEDWQRTERARAARFGIARMGVALAAAFIAIAALIVAIVAWSHHHFDRRVFWPVAGLLFIASIVNSANGWEAIGMRLQTAEPVVTQVALAAGGALIAAASGALLGGLLAGVAVYAARAHVEATLDVRALWLRGAAVALIAIGVDALIGAMAPDLVPVWPRYDAENAWLPWLSRVTGSAGVITLIAGTVVALYWVDRLTGGWTRRRDLAFIVLALAEAAIAAIKADGWLELLVAGLTGGAVSTLLFATVLRFDLRAVPALAAVYLAVNYAADAALKGTASAIVLDAIAIATTLTLAWVATRYLLAPGPRPEGAPGAPEPVPPGSD